MKSHDKVWFTHDQIIQGGTLEFEMGDTPNTEWGAVDLNISTFRDDTTTNSVQIAELKVSE